MPYSMCQLYIGDFYVGGKLQPCVYYALLQIPPLPRFPQGVRKACWQHKLEIQLEEEEV